MEVYEQAIVTRRGITPSSFTAAWYRDVTTKALDTEPQFGNSLIHLCAYTDNTSWLSTLLSINSVDVNIQNHHGETPLHWASKMNSLDTAELLIRAGGDLHARDQSESCPLHLAAAQGHPEMVMLLLNHHGDVDAVDADGCTALVVARQQMNKLMQTNKQSLTSGTQSTVEGVTMSRSSHNAFMSVITILQRHKNQQHNNHNPLLTTNEHQRGRSASPNRRKGTSSQPSYLRDTKNSSRSRSPSPPPPAATNRIRKNNPTEEPPKPAFYIPKIEYAPAFFITSSDSAEIPPMKTAHHHNRRGNVQTNASSALSMSMVPRGDTTTDDSIFDMLGGHGLGPSDYPNTDHRGASLSPPRPPYAYAAPNGSAVYKVRSKVSISPTKQAFTGHVSIANTSLYQAAVKLDPTPTPTSSFLSNTSNSAPFHAIGRKASRSGLGGNAQGSGLGLGPGSTPSLPIHSLPFIIRSPSLRCELDCIVVVEHCWNCELHSSYCRHDPAKYSYQANLCLAAVCEGLLMQRLPIRLIAYKVRAKDGDCTRLGALEVNIGIRVAVNGSGSGGNNGTSNSSGSSSGNGGSTTGTGTGVKELVWKSQLLHSKIKSGTWPSHVALKKAATAYICTTLSEAGYTGLPAPVPPPTPLIPITHPSATTLDHSMTSTSQHSNNSNNNSPHKTRSKNNLVLEDESDDDDIPSKKSKDGLRSSNPSTSQHSEYDHYPLSSRPSQMNSARGSRETSRPSTPPQSPGMEGSPEATQGKRGTRPGVKTTPTTPAITLNEKIKNSFDQWISRMKFASKKPPSEPVQGLVQGPGQGIGVGKTTRMLSQKSQEYGQKGEHALSIGGDKDRLDLTLDLTTGLGGAITNRASEYPLDITQPGGSPSSLLHTKRSTFSGPSAYWPPEPTAKPPRLHKNTQGDDVLQGRVSPPKPIPPPLNFTQHGRLIPNHGHDNHHNNHQKSNLSMESWVVLDKLKTDVVNKPKEFHGSSEAPSRAFGYRRGTFFGYPKGLTLPSPSLSTTTIANISNPEPPMPFGGKFAGVNSNIPKTAPSTLTDFELFESLVIKHFTVFDDRVGVSAVTTNGSPPLTLQHRRQG